MDNTSEDDMFEEYLEEFLEEDNLDVPSTANQQISEDTFADIIIENCDLSSDNEGVTIEEKNTPTRKRQRNPENWKRNKIKRLRQEGKSYISEYSRKVIPAKGIKNTKDCLNKCALLCKLISASEREHIFKDYYALGIKGKRQFLLNTTERKAPYARRPGKNGNNSKKQHSFMYFFDVKGNRIQVCKDYFLGTLSISQKPIYSVHNTKTEVTGLPKAPGQGKHRKTTIPESFKEEVRSHIASFPKISSHYCRKNTVREYLEPHLTVREMFRLYKVKMEENSKSAVKESLYRHIFNNEFNLFFHTPKKDRCDLCEEYKAYHNSKNLTSLEEEKYLRHQEEKNEARSKREVDRISSTCVVCFDLQNVMSCPKAEISSFFYLSKLNVYNLTAHVSVNSKAYCCIWNETQMGRGGNDIASALIKILEAVCCDLPEVSEYVLWSDSCVPQNRNSIMSFAIIDFMKNHPSINKISMKFSTPGHSSIQEIDNVHSVIDRSLKKREFFSPISLMRLLLKVTYKGQPLKIIQMLPESDFKNFTACANLFNFRQIPYTKVSELVFTQSLTVLEFKTSHSQTQFEEVNIKEVKLPTRQKSLRNRVVEMPTPVPLPPKTEISDQKIKCFKAMLKYMPQVDREFFESVITNKSKN